MFHHPDAPAATIHRPGLTPGLEEVYFATLKWDGWRCQIRRVEAGLEFLSKTGRPLPISGDCIARVTPYLMPLPVGTVLDGEWQGRRPAFRQEALWVFDALALPLIEVLRLDAWGGHPPVGSIVAQVHDVRCLTAWERFQRTAVLVPALITPHAEKDLGGFFDHHKGRPDAEGIVLKSRSSTYTGSVSKCAYNRGWCKVKWRAGESGESPLI